MDKKLIINTDDFGMTSGINYGILNAYLNHSISSISMMINQPHTHEAVAIMEKYAINCVGLHINLTFGDPINNTAAVPTLLDKNGKFKNPAWWLLHDQQVYEEELIKETNSQILLFRKLTGNMPNHVSFHHKYDFCRKFPNLASFLIKNYSLPIRSGFGLPNYPYEKVLTSDFFMNAKNANLFKQLNHPFVELPCHAGFIDKQLTEISSMVNQRIEDSFMVNSTSFKQAYHDLGYRLVGWEKVQMKKQN